MTRQHFSSILDTLLSSLGFDSTQFKHSQLSNQGGHYHSTGKHTRCIHSNAWKVEEQCTPAVHKNSSTGVHLFLKIHGFTLPVAALIQLWQDLQKGVLYAHNFKSQFSPPFDRYNNRLTAHACIIAKGSTVYFYWGLFHGPVRRPSVLGWSVNGSNFPGQTDSWQGITKQLSGKTGPWCSYILWHAELKTAWIKAIWP